MDKYLRTLLCTGLLITSMSKGHCQLEIENAVSSLNRHKIYTIDLASSMPEDYFDFKPTDSVRTFAEILLHIASSNYWFVYLITDKTNLFESNKFLRGKYSKHDIIKLVEESYDNAINSISKLNYSELQKELKWTNRLVKEDTRNKLEVMHILIEHASHHRGQLTVYLRLKGIVPPAYID